MFIFADIDLMKRDPENHAAPRCTRAYLSIYYAHSSRMEIVRPEIVFRTKSQDIVVGSRRNYERSAAVLP